MPTASQRVGAQNPGAHTVNGGDTTIHANINVKSPKDVGPAVRSLKPLGGMAPALANGMQ
jgi:hypothetical protein